MSRYHFTLYDINTLSPISDLMNVWVRHAYYGDDPSDGPVGSIAGKDGTITDSGMRYVNNLAPGDYYIFIAHGVTNFGSTRRVPYPDNLLIHDTKLITKFNPIAVNPMYRVGQPTESYELIFRYGGYTGTTLSWGTFPYNFNKVPSVRLTQLTSTSDGAEVVLVKCYIEENSYPNTSTLYMGLSLNKPGALVGNRSVMLSLIWPAGPYIGIP